MLIAAFAAMFFLVSCGDGKKEEEKSDSTTVKTETVDTMVIETQPAAEASNATTDAKPEKEPVTNTQAPVRGNN